ncbi:MAG: sigma-70 family RNA polymerase sigma factor [Oscillospiraceae bacterium]|nr:sigma-70 family RNA polymerase sigma factor [Oscillospiraceae bacterium]
MDPELCLRAKQGDADAFASLYESVSSRLYSTAFYMLGRREDAEDVVMETVTDAFAEISSLRDPGAFEGWIFRILMNKIKRRRKSYIGESVELNEDISFSEGGDRDEQIALRNALGSLPETDRSILVLDILGGYRSDEIGDMLGMNPNTVRSRKLRALEKLRNMLGGERDGR